MPTTLPTAIRNAQPSQSSSPSSSSSSSTPAGTAIGSASGGGVIRTGVIPGTTVVDRSTTPQQAIAQSALLHHGGGGSSSSNQSTPTQSTPTTSSNQEIQSSPANTIRDIIRRNSITQQVQSQSAPATSSNQRLATQNQIQPATGEQQNRRGTLANAFLRTSTFSQFITEVSQVGSTRGERVVQQPRIETGTIIDKSYRPNLTFAQRQRMQEIESGTPLDLVGAPAEAKAARVAEKGAKDIVDRKQRQAQAEVNSLQQRLQGLVSSGDVSVEQANASLDKSVKEINLRYNSEAQIEYTDKVIPQAEKVYVTNLGLTSRAERPTGQFLSKAIPLAVDVGTDVAVTAAGFTLGGPIGAGLAFTGISTAKGTYEIAKSKSTREDIGAAVRIGGGVAFGVLPLANKGGRVIALQAARESSNIAAQKSLGLDITDFENIRISKPSVGKKEILFSARKEFDFGYQEATGTLLTKPAKAEGTTLIAVKNVERKTIINDVLGRPIMQRVEFPTTAHGFSEEVLRIGEGEGTQSITKTRITSQIDKKPEVFRSFDISQGKSFESGPFEDITIGASQRVNSFADRKGIISVVKSGTGKDTSLVLKPRGSVTFERLSNTFKFTKGTNKTPYFTVTDGSGQQQVFLTATQEHVSNVKIPQVLGSLNVPKQSFKVSSFAGMGLYERQDSVVMSTPLQRKILVTTKRGPLNSFGSLVNPVITNTREKTLTINMGASLIGTGTIIRSSSGSLSSSATLQAVAQASSFKRPTTNPPSNFPSNFNAPFKTPRATPLVDFPQLSSGVRKTGYKKPKAQGFRYAPSFTAIGLDLRGGKQPLIIPGGYSPFSIRRIGAKARKKSKLKLSFNTKPLRLSFT